METNLKEMFGKETTQYQSPEIEVVEVELEGVIAATGCVVDNCTCNIGFGYSSCSSDCSANRPRSNSSDLWEEDEEEKEDDWGASLKG